MADRSHDLLVAPEAAALLALLREGGPRTRAQLTALTGLSRSTVAARIETLLDAGLVAPVGEEVSTGGRPPGRLAFRARARLVLAVDLGATHAVVALTDLAGTVLAHRSRRVPIADGPEPVLSWVLTTGLELLAGTGRPASDLAGVGIGVPGPVEHLTGTPVSPPIMPGWDRYDVPARVREAFDVPVLVDNDVNLLALAEHASVWPDREDLLFVKVATGIGAGIVSGGGLQRGAQGSAGDLGHVRIPGTDGRTLEAVASGAALARALTGQGIPAAGTDDVVDLARAGNLAVLDAVRQAGRDLGEVLATCVNLLNPSVIVIGGGLSLVGDHLLAGVREIVYRHSTPLATQHLTVVQAASGELGGVLGAATLVTRHVLDPVPGTPGGNGTGRAGR
ncbi:ROK family protein [Pseudonocardia nematodicida]|uniref:ROK family protein n=1 Tax=Pseudonocardia nematodicida TaxID=1206997 RepID=A0ABV1KH27_9PSEU